MLKVKDLLSLGFYEKSPFTGSLGDLRYRLEKTEDEERGKALLLTTWPGPFAFDTTEDEKKERKTFPFSEEGLAEVTDFLNEKAGETGA